MHNWENYCKHYIWNESLGLGIDTSKIDNFNTIASLVNSTEIFSEMMALEAGKIANIDENRMVGHYWLRNPCIAPTESIRLSILKSWEEIDNFVRDIHNGILSGQNGPFKNLLCIGIGGSALGPQLASRALKNKQDKLELYFIDNTDPDGIDQILSQLDTELGRTLVIVTSKSGGTPETRNGMIEVAQYYTKKGLNFNRHAVAITCEDSQLDKQAKEEHWLKRFPMWDWVGGRTSISSVVGLLPLALQGIDYKEFLRGFKEIDNVTRQNKEDNPAFLLAKSWFAATEGVGKKSMIILPYKDRLSLLAAFLQQLIMESLGKKLDRSGNFVYQGISVFGNKGSTDQHAYVQQLRDGLNNFFVTFVEVLQDRNGPSLNVENEITTGDYLEGFLLGTRLALQQEGRESITITIQCVDAFHLGILIGLYERAVGFYASMINVNAYHQPGVEAGKKAASQILSMQKSLLSFLKNHPTEKFSAKDLSHQLQIDDIEILFKILEHLSANRHIQRYYSEDINLISYQF